MNNSEKSRMVRSNLKGVLPEAHCQIEKPAKAKKRKLEIKMMMDNMNGGLLLGSCCFNFLTLANVSLGY